MGTQLRTSRIVRRLPQVLAATLIVAVGPVAVVWTLRRGGVIASPVLAIVVGAVLAFAVSSLGAMLWKSRSDSGDLLFSELMLWGWLRRLWLERRIRNTLALLEGVDDGKGLSRERRAELLLGLAHSLEAGDPYTSGHSRRVARHAERIARRLGLPQHEVAKVRTAAALHDIGKLDTPREILHKRGRLTDEEFAVIKEHPARGGELAEQLGDPELAAIIRHHHERIDGTGYPDGLAGETIPLAARIIAVADTFDAIISTRPYRPGAPHRTAIGVLTAEAGTQLDPNAVRAFTSVYSGRRSLSLWMVFTSAPERLASWLSGSFNGATAAGVAQVMTASAVSTVAAASVIAAPPLKPAANFSASQASLVQMASSSGNAGQLTGSPPASSTGLTGAAPAQAGATSRTPSLSALTGAAPTLTGSGTRGRGSTTPSGVPALSVTPGSGAGVTVTPSGASTSPATTVTPSSTPSSGSGGAGGNGGSSGGGGNSGSGGSGGSGHAISSGGGGSAGGQGSSGSSATAPGHSGTSNGNSGGQSTGGGSSNAGSGNSNAGGNGNGNGNAGASSNAGGGGGNAGGGSNAGGSGSSNAGGSGGGSNNASGSNNAGGNSKVGVSSNAGTSSNAGGNGKGKNG